MAERIVSPGVFTNEKDQSFLPRGISEIGAAIIGTTIKGPAQIPTKINSFSDFQEIFGTYTEDSYVPFTVQEYLNNAGVVTVTRLLYEDGYQLDDGVLGIIASSGSGLSVASNELLGSFTSVSASAGTWTTGLTGSTGAGAIATVVLDTTGSISSVTVTNPGIGYIIGETVTASTGSLGFFSGSLTFTLVGGDIENNEYVTHVLHPTDPVSTVGSGNSLFEASYMADANSGSFAISISGSWQNDSTVPGFSGAYTKELNISSSIDSTSNKYLSKVFGTSPKGIDYPVYVQYENSTATDLFTNMGHVTTSLAILGSYKCAQDYQPASTPYITSQKIGTTAVNLFKFHTLSHGNVENYDVKVGIRDIKLASEVADPNGYGTFSVEVRKVNNTDLPNSPFDSDDTDKTPDVVETFQSCNLDPDSPNYVVRKIGDQYVTIDSEGKLRDNGEYPNLSKYIRIEATTGVSNKTNDKTLIPFGFRSPYSPVPDMSASYGEQNLYPITYATSQVVSSAYSAKNYYGFDYTNIHNLNYLAPTPTSASSTGSNSDFYLGTYSQSAEANFPSVTAPYSGTLQSVLDVGTFDSNIALDTRKFMVPAQGGFDGARPNLPKFSGTNITAANTFGFNCNSATSTGTKAYKKAFDALSNTDYFDINMLVTPGILHSIHPAVTADAREMAEDRQDTFYVMDTAQITDNITTTINNVTSLDSNYTSTYFPWVRILDPAKNKPLWVPPSVVVPGALSFNDATAAPWYAPAGLNRGGLSAAFNTYEKLTQGNRDDLYEARINPIANFPNTGICIWGQKTLQARPSALDRVNVRRLLITVKKFIASATKYLVFEQNTDATRNRFLSIVNPYLDGVKSQQGLSAFRVVMDATNNTPDLIDQNILYGQIFLQPTRTAEFIVLDFNIQPTGASFPE